MPKKLLKISKSGENFASHVLMVEPTCFFLNEETFKDNKFMQKTSDSK